jgi:hypothetical protein
MARAENKTVSKKYRKVSILNWMGTLILTAIPGVNIVALILFTIFAKAQAKRSFAVAMLILMILSFALVFTAFLLFPYELSEIAAQMRGGDAVTLLAATNG